MSATVQRDRILTLVKSDPKKALEQARAIRDPWFRAQALSWVARFTDTDPCSVACEAAHAAKECDDDFKRTAVRAWEIAALGERGLKREARKSLEEAVTVGKSIEPASSRSEALFLLLQAAFRIDQEAAEKLFEVLKASCSSDEHWRCKRAVRNGERMVAGEMKPRAFF